LFIEISSYLAFQFTATSDILPQIALKNNGDISVFAVATSVLVLAKHW